MKTKIKEAFYSVFAFYLFGCGLAVATMLIMLLIPLLLIAILCLIVGELFSRKRKSISTKQRYTNKNEQSKTGTIRYLLPNKPSRKAA